ncbi:hypothetical protein AAHA92_33759 [Salvia divinorum]|uniref:Uncharacterized protein n=1 Tax=Salvia divinorum TaxID=28513 RepID=A0ABD1FQ29_SALDI
MWWARYNSPRPAWALMILLAAAGESSGGMLSEQVFLEQENTFRGARNSDELHLSVNKVLLWGRAVFVLSDSAVL